MIFCDKCNTALSDDATVCTNCGTEIIPPANEFYEETPAEEHVECVDETKITKLSDEVLLWGIISLAVSAFLSRVLGIIFACIGLNAKKKLKAMIGELEGKAKVGGILSLCALIYSICTFLITACLFGLWLLYMVGIVSLGILSSSM